MAVVLTMPSAMPSTSARSSSRKSVASVENPSSLGIWLTMTVRAMPFR